MSATTIFRQHRALRWLIPVGVVGAVGFSGAVAGGAFDSPNRPELLQARTAAQVIGDVRAANATGLSGTAVVQLALGPADSPQLLAAADTGRARSLSALLTGSHTIRYWYGGPQRQRAVLLGATDETDVFRSGQDLWQWDSAEHIATHSVLTDGRTPISVATLMPQELAAKALAAVDADTTVNVTAGGRVADRPTYQLALTPHDDGTRIASVRIAVDSTRHVPLAVQVYARGQDSPVVDVSFISVSFRRPPTELFAFTPPPGATVQSGSPGPVGLPGAVSVIGSGWTSVVSYRAARAELTRLAGPVLSALTRVQGKWGKGGLLDSSLLCVLVTDDGRVLAGPVEPSVLYAAAARR